MKIKYFIFLIVISLLVIISKNRKEINDMSFNRQKSVNNIILSNNIDSIHTIPEHNFIFQADSLLFYYFKDKEKTPLYQWNIFDLKRNCITSKGNMNTPSSLITDYANNYIFYTLDGSIIIENLSNQEIKNISHFSGEPYSIFSISHDKLLVLGTFKRDNIYKTGFYEISTTDNNVKLIRHIENIKDSSFIQKNSLIYSGNFVKSKNYILYFCDKQSDVYIFNPEGNFIADFKTKDNVPKPIIQTFNDTYLYKRKHTFRSNIGMYERNNVIYVLSYRCSEDNIVLDKYDIKGAYIGSVFLYDIKLPNKNVNNLFGIGKNIILNTENSFIVLELNDFP